MHLTRSNATMAAAGAGPGDPNLPQTPDLPLVNIAGYLSPMDVRALSQTCKRLRNLFHARLARQPPGLARRYPRLERFEPQVVGFGADNQLVAFTSDSQIVHTSLATGEARRIHKEGADQGYPYLELSGDCTRVVVGKLHYGRVRNPEVVVFNMRDGSRARAVQTERYHPIEAVAINHGGTHIAVSHEDDRALARPEGGYELGGSVAVYTVDSDAAPVVLPGNGTRVYRVAINRDGTRVVTTRTDHTIQLWDGRTGALIYMCDVNEEGALPGPLRDPRLDDREHDVLGSAFCLGLSPDGARLAAGNHNGVLRVWNTADGRRIFSRHMGFGNVHSVVYNPTGTRLAVSFARPRGLIAIYNTANYSRLCSFSPEPLTVVGQEPHAMDIVDGENFHLDSASWLAFSPDGTMLVSCDGRKVLVWHLGRCA